MTIIQMSSPNFNARKNGASPQLIVLHYTGMETAKDALDRLCDAASEVSAHYTVDEDGTVYQHVEEPMRAWHAGAGAWCGLSDINSHSIGIEIVNKGHEHGYHDFAKMQIKSVIGLCQDVMERHLIEPQNVIAHSDLAPLRKQDPGEKFPWQELAQNSVGIWPSVSSEDIVKASGIDVYQALHDFGYECEDKQSMLIAFQRHFVPEIFEKGLEGTITSQTKSRLYAILAGHIGAGASSKD